MLFFRGEGYLSGCRKWYACDDERLLLHEAFWFPELHIVMIRGSCGAIISVARAFERVDSSEFNVDKGLYSVKSAYMRCRC